MADLPQAMRLHRLDQAGEHVPSFPRRPLKIRQSMPVVDLALGDRILDHMPMLGLPGRGQPVA